MVTPVLHSYLGSWGHSSVINWHLSSRDQSDKAHHLETSMPIPPLKYRVHPQFPAVLKEYALHSNDKFLFLEAPLKCPRSLAKLSLMNHLGPSTEHSSLEYLLYSRLPGECGVDFICYTSCIWGFLFLGYKLTLSLLFTKQLTFLYQIVTIFWSCLVDVTPRPLWLIRWVF